MGQQQGRVVGSRRGKYAALSSIDLERLASERGLGRRRRSGLLEADRATLIALLKAYDAGALASNGKVLAANRCGGGPQCIDGSTGYWYEGAPLLEVIPDWVRSDLEVVAQILYAPSHKGVDIGGTLWKLVSALPESVEAEHRYPNEFGTTGRTRLDLDLDLEWKGQRHKLRFVSGATSQIEACIPHLGEELDLDQPSSQDGESDENSTRASSTQDKDGDETEAVYSPPRRCLADSRCASSNSIASLGSWTPREQKVHAAGGGAHKFADLFHKNLQMEMVAVPELKAVVDGLRFLMLHARSGNLFVPSDDDAVPQFPEPLFPFLVVNVGSGVSILRVDSPSEPPVRVGGTACGGGTFLGLARALTSAETFEEALRLAEGGDASRCDLLVSDIYGNEGSASLGLPGNLTAANFGRLCGDAPDEEDSDAVCSEQDLARSLLQMVTQQAVLLSSAFAHQFGCIDRVFFVGGFVEEANHLARKTIADNFRKMNGRAYFLRHCDFLGALGSLWKGLLDAEGSSQ